MGQLCEQRSCRRGVRRKARNERQQRRDGKHSSRRQEFHECRPREEEEEYSARMRINTTRTTISSSMRKIGDRTRACF